MRGNDVLICKKSTVVPEFGNRFKKPRMQVLLLLVALAANFAGSTSQDAEVTCGRAPSVEHATVTSPKASSYAVGTVITYACSFGYVAKSADFSSECLLVDVDQSEDDQFAEWTDPKLFCIPRSCGDPGFVPNAHRIGSLFTFPNSITFECEEGYELVGSGIRYCHASGSWSGKLPACKNVFCPPPSDLANGKVTFSSLGYGSELKYECDKGFLLRNHQPRLCTKDGTWSGDVPDCREAQCDPLIAPEDGYVDLVGGEPRIGSIAVYTCEGDRKIDGSGTSKCLSTGQWTFPTPKCLHPCRIPKIENGRIGRYQTNRRRKVFITLAEGTKLEDDEELFLQCALKFEPMGKAKSEEKVACEKGKWLDIPRCEPASCRSKPPETENGQIISADSVQGGTVTYHCNQYYKKAKYGNVTCDFGAWKGVTPICKDTRCDVEQLSFPGLVKEQKKVYYSGQSFAISCEKGYEVSKPGGRLSCRDGRWNGHLPPCVAANCSREPPFPEHGQAKLYTGIHSSKVSYECEESYFLQGSSSVVCLFGQWEGQPPSCKDSNCYSADLKHSAGTILGGVTLTGNRLDAECYEGYYPKGQKPLCASGKWEEYGTSPCKESDCSVYVIANGAFTERAFGDETFNWRSFRWEKKAFQKKVLVGATKPPQFPLYVTCDSSYTFQGKGSNDVVVTCKAGKWMPHPVCLITGTRYEEEKLPESNGLRNGKPAVTAVKVEMSRSVTRAKATVPPTAVTFSEDLGKHAEDKNKPDLISHGNDSSADSCFCVYSGLDPNVVAFSGNEQLKFGTKVKNNCTVRFYCQPFGYYYLMGPTEITCKDCRNWHSSEYPNCRDPVSGDTVVLFDKNVRVLPGGDLEIEHGATVRITCIANNINKFPIWKFPPSENIQTQSSYVSQNRITMNAELLDIVEAKVKHSGTYECAVEGYRPRILGITIRDPDLRCPAIKNEDKYIIDYEKERVFNSRVMFHCTKLGQKLDGPLVLTCLANGHWSGEPPECVDITCPSLEEIEDMRITYTNVQNIGSIAAFHCFSPRHISGKAQIKCERNGKWSDPLPSCTLSTCSMDSLFLVIPEGVVPNMDDVKQDTMPYGFIIRLTCEGNLRLSGPSEAKCGKDGSWEVAADLQCVPGCSVLEKAEDSQLIVDPEKNFYRFGELATLSCPPGYSLTSEVERVMCLSGGWSENEIPDCRAI